MYIFKNAFRCISRAKGRNFLIGLIVMLLSVSSCLGLSIKQANKTLKKQYADNMEISASLNLKKMGNEGISLETLEEYANGETVKAFYKTASVYFSAGDGIEPLDVAGSFQKNKDFREQFGDVKNGEQRTTQTESYSTEASGVTTLSNSKNISMLTEENTQSENSSSSTADNTQSNTNESSQNNQSNQMPEQWNNSANSTDESGKITQPSADGNNAQSMPGGGNTFITNNYFFNMASMDDFTLTGYDNVAALPEYISSLDVISFENADYSCVISQNLADENSLAVGDTFTLKNPNNEDETYSFTIIGICDTSQSTESNDSSSNASFTDNNIYVNYKTVEDIIAKSAEINGDETVEDNEEKQVALSATYSGNYIFANLTDYNSFKENISEDYTVVSEDVSNYEESISQLEALGKYATYFLIVIFVIGAFVLVIINLFSIRNRKYEIGVLTAIGMKKYKVALQFVTELFVVTFIALIIGSTIGAVSSVPVTNSLLQTVNSTQQQTDVTFDNKTPSVDGNNSDSQNSTTPPEMPGNSGNGGFQNFENFKGMASNYVASVNSATNLTVILQMIGIGILLTIISGLAAMLFVMRYEPLKILNNRD